MRSAGASRVVGAPDVREARDTVDVSAVLVATVAKVSGYLRRRRRPRADTHARVRTALAHRPALDRNSSDGNESTVRTLIELRAIVNEARRCARRRSLARSLLYDAHMWIAAWLDEWTSGELPTLHMFALHQEIVQHLRNVAERLSTMVGMEIRQTQAHDQPSTESDGS
jgi:hypothetical protein